MGSVDTLALYPRPYYLVFSFMFGCLQKRFVEKSTSSHY